MKTNLKLELFPRDKGTFVPSFDVTQITGRCRRSAEMNASVKVSGVLLPVLLSKSNEGGFKVHDGQSRITAARENGNLDLPALVFEDGSDAFTIITNLCRSRNPSSEYAAYKAIMLETGLADSEIGEKLGISKSRLQMFSRVDTRLINEAREMFASRKITLEQAKVLSKLPKPTQKKMLRDGDVSTKKLREELREKGSVSKAINALPDTLFAEPPVLEAKLKECLLLAESDEGGSKYAAQAISRIIKKLAGGES